MLWEIPGLSSWSALPESTRNIRAVGSDSEEDGVRVNDAVQPWDFRRLSPGITLAVSSPGISRAQPWDFPRLSPGISQGSALGLPRTWPKDFPGLSPGNFLGFALGFPGLSPGIFWGSALGFPRAQPWDFPGA